MQEKVSEKMQERVFSVILKRPENLDCADCTSKGPGWVSIDYGAFICMNCAGAHRVLGPSVTRVRSTKLDSWVQENIDIMEGIGNAVANSYYEYAVPKSYPKPAINASLDTLIRFVQDKYVKKLFIPSPPAIDPKTAFLATRQALKPFYFEAQLTVNKPVQAPITSGLGDLLDMEQDDFNDFTHQPPVQPQIINSISSPPGVYQETMYSNASYQGSNSVPQLGSSVSLSPEKVQPTSSQSLNLMNLYNQAPPSIGSAILPTQATNQNKYAYLQQMGKPAQPQQQPLYYQNPPLNVQQAWQQPPQQQVLPPNQQPAPGQGGQVNIMNLYGQQTQANQQPYSAFNQSNNLRSQQ